jgi:uncharacterized protein (DUF433 family)
MGAKFVTIAAQRPYFIWDYDLSEADVRAILRGDETHEKTWLVSRILESAAYEDVWKYLTLAELRTLFPSLQLKPQVRAAWEFALQVWDAESPRE